MAKETPENGGWKRPSTSFGDTYRFEKEGDEFVGTLIAKYQDKGLYSSSLYKFELDDGKVVAIWGGANLDMQMDEVPLHSLVKIIYRGKQFNPKTKREFHAYEVLFKPLVEQPEEEIPF